MPSKQIPPGWGESRGKLPPGWKREETKLYEEAAPEEPSAAVPVPEEPERIADAQTPAPAPAVPEPVEEESPKPEEPKPVEPEPEELRPAEPEPEELKPEETGPAKPEPEESEPEPPKPEESTPEEPEPEEPEPEKPHPEQPKKKAPRSPRKKRPVWVYGLGAAAVVCLCCTAAWIWLRGEATEKSSRPTPAPGVVAEHTPAITPTPAADPTAKNTDAPNTPLPSPTPSEYQREQTTPESSEPPMEASPAPEDEWRGFERFGDDDVDTYCRICGSITTFQGSIDGMCEDCWNLYGNTSNTPKEVPTENTVAPVPTPKATVKPSEAPATTPTPVTGNYHPGTYTCAAKGYGGPVTATVTVDDNKILSVSLSGPNETPAVGGAALPYLESNAMIQGASMDGVAGATATSEAARNAVRAALESADRNEQTVKRAQFWLSYAGYSRDRLIWVLEVHDKFTHEEAVYGVDHCGVADWSEQALRSAKRWVESNPTSYDGMISHLEGNDFTHEEAVYGADHCGADWREQALKCAKQRIQYPHSYSSLMNMMEAEGFTHEDTIYAIDNCGANWNEQAVRRAQVYWVGYSRNQVIEFLETDGFTHEEAVYGVDHCGVDWNQ